MKKWLREQLKNKKALLGALGLFIVGGLIYLAYGFHLAPPKASQDWAAWAQAYGATLALAVAIYVPYRQREDAEKDKKAKEAELDALRTYSVSLILSDVVALLDRSHAYQFARKYIRDPLIVADLLERIRLAEFNDPDLVRALNLGPARSAVLLVQQFWSDDGTADIPLNEVELKKILDHRSLIDGYKKQVDATFGPNLQRHLVLNPERFRRPLDRLKS